MIIDLIYMYLKIIIYKNYYLSSIKKVVCNDYKEINILSSTENKYY